MKIITKRISIGTILFLIVILSLLKWLDYREKAMPNKVSYSKGWTTNQVDIAKIFDGTRDKNLKRIDELAKLCEIVYRRNDNDISEWNSWSKSKVVPIFIDTSKIEKNIIRGLYYEIWELDETSNSKIVAIVFRGTKVTSDWLANARWFRKFFDRQSFDHYDQLNVISNQLIKSIEDEYANNDKELTIIATGHSLGGGLAQFMAYAESKVNLVYAFNSSPVTGYYDLEKSKRIQNAKGVYVYRLYESGEALSFARKAMFIPYPAPLFYTDNPAIIRIRFSFSTGKDSFSQHSIKQMAEELKKLKG